MQRIKNPNAGNSQSAVPQSVGAKGDFTHTSPCDWSILLQ